MKSLASLFAVLTIFGSVTSYATRDKPCGCYGVMCWSPAVQACYQAYACAPKVVENNLATTDRIMKQYAESEAFADATAFKAEVQRIQALPMANRMAEYFAAVGVNPENNDEIAHFVYGRSPKDKNLHAFKASMGLSDQQANQILDSLTTALANGVR